MRAVRIPAKSERLGNRSPEALWARAGDSEILIESGEKRGKINGKTGRSVEYARRLYEDVAAESRTKDSRDNKDAKDKKDPVSASFFSSLMSLLSFVR